MSEVDKCAIAADAVGYIAEDESHWTKGYLLRSDTIATSDESSAEHEWKLHPEAGWPVCAIGSIVRACVKHNVPVWVRENDEDGDVIREHYGETFHELIDKLRETVGDVKGRSSTELFNDDAFTTHEEVVEVMTTWKDEVCHVSNGSE